MGRNRAIIRQHGLLAWLWYRYYRLAFRFRP